MRKQNVNKNPGMALFFKNVSVNNPSGTVQILKEAGYKFTPKNPMQAAYMLRDMVLSDKDKALEKIAMIHPDRELIIKSMQNSFDASKDCIDCNGYNFNADGEQKSLNEKTMNKLIIAGAGVIALGLITVIITA